MTREDAIDYLSVLAERMDTKDTDLYVADIPLECVDMAIEALKQEPKWIPVSERQPEENGNYLAFYCESDGTATLEFMMVDHCNAGGGWLHEESGRRSYKKVIAWMPLPKPYEPQESEDKE